MSARVGPDYIPSASRPPGTCAKSTGDEHIGASREAMVRASVGSESGVGSAEGSATLGRNSLVSHRVSLASGLHPSQDGSDIYLLTGSVGRRDSPVQGCDLHRASDLEQDHLPAARRSLHHARMVGVAGPIPGARRCSVSYGRRPYRFMRALTSDRPAHCWRESDDAS